MATLPRLPGVEATEQEAQPALTFPDRFLKTLVVRSTLTKSSVKAVIQHYNYDESVLGTTEETMECDAYEEAAKYTVAEQALGVILNWVLLKGQEKERLVRIEKKQQAIEQALLNDPEVDVSSLEAEKATEEVALEAVRTQMGPKE